MFKKAQQYSCTLWHLLHVDLIAYTSSRYINELIDSLMWTAITLVVSAKLLTAPGLPSNFGIFTAATIPAVRCLFQVYPRTTAMIIDLMSNKAITYDITLPIPSWLAISRIAISSFIRSMMLSVFSLPFGLIFVWNEFNQIFFSLPHFTLILVMSALVQSFFSLLIASYVTTAEQLASTWSRVIFPIWLLGCWQFTWASMLQKMPWIAYASLLNPVVYTMEGMRAAVLGQTGNLPYWNCIAALCIFTLIFAYISIKNMKKRLDCV
jgi:ABC-2 type transport system permease protein